MNREEWLTELIDSLRPMFKTHGATVPEKIRVTCGWPSKSAMSSKRRRVGECWQSIASADGTTEIFISPCVADSVEVAAILAHELVHASGAKGHRGTFKKIATAIGLAGPMRATTAGPELKERLNDLCKEIGPYPHAVLDQSQGPTKKQGTRLIKITCPSCGYTARTTAKWLEVGLPVCPCGTEMEVR